jgi:hypothetical protein
MVINMMKTAAVLLSTAALAVSLIPLPAQAQVKAEAPAAQADGVFATLPGRWVRPDGGYVINIRSVDANGKLDASYANPNPLPFSRAEATRDGNTIRLFFELRAGGYSGSTYTLSYDPVSDTLKGVYFQAVAQQRFDVYFARAK